MAAWKVATLVALLDEWWVCRMACVRDDLTADLSAAERAATMAAHWAALLDGCWAEMSACSWVAATAAQKAVSKVAHWAAQTVVWKAETTACTKDC